MGGQDRIYRNKNSNRMAKKMKTKMELKNKEIAVSWRVQAEGHSAEIILILTGKVWKGIG